MKKLVRCVFCNTVIPIKELGLKDKDIGDLCKPCHTWLNEVFLKCWRDSNA